MPSLRLSYQLLNIVYLLEASYNAVNLFCYQYKLDKLERPFWEYPPQ